MAVKSQAEARKIADTLLEKIDFLKRQAHERSERFESLSAEQLVNKIMGKTSKSPYFYFQSWGSAPPGGSASYSAGVHNPDPAGYSGFSLFGYLLFGPANFIGSSDLALTSVDVRFQRYFQRCAVAAGSDTTMTFTINVPATINSGIYIGNCFLVLRSPFDVGSYMDRAGFDLTVS